MQIWATQHFGEIMMVSVKYKQSYALLNVPILTKDQPRHTIFLIFKKC